MATQITNENFDKFIGASETVLVDFWAPWCGPCMMLSPIIDEVVDDCPDGVSIGKVNVDEFPEIAQRYDVLTIPTLIVFKNGEVSKREVGLRNKDAILEMLG